MLRPVEVLVLQLGRRLRIPAHDHAVDHAADQCAEAEDKEHHAQDPVKECSDEDIVSGLEALEGFKASLTKQTVAP